MLCAAAETRQIETQQRVKMRHFGGSNRGLVLQLVQLARLVGYGGSAGLGLPGDEGWRRHCMELYG